MLFSEPKIPQLIPYSCAEMRAGGFSALQRAENSSTGIPNSSDVARLDVSVLFSEPKIPQPGGGDVVDQSLRWFQCSSASRKFLNGRGRCVGGGRRVGFQCSSASRKVLNRSLRCKQSVKSPRFQCSSASRKFLNCAGGGAGDADRRRFSALQRAENSSTSGQKPNVESSS